MLLYGQSNHFVEVLASINLPNYIVGMQIGNLTISGGIFLAPLAGISNRPFRLLARRFGAAMAYTEMISADALARNQAKTIAMIDIEPDEHPVGVQLFGAKREYIAASVEKLAKFSPDVIDLNFGCPVKKVIRKNGGAAVLKDLGLAEKLMRAAAENTDIPVTIKIRSGWSSNDAVYLELGKLAEDCGISAITFHPRSRNQNYGDRADWSQITELKKQIKIPVIGNGDVKSGPDAEAMFDETGCDAIMIGRAAMRNPRIFYQINKYLETGEEPPGLSTEEKIDLALEHARMTTLTYGEKVGAKMMRKHLAWYTKGMRESGELRKNLMSVESYKEIENLLRDYNEEIVQSD